MEERRKLERPNLAFFPRLFDRATGRLVGTLDNLTAEGVMVIGQCSLEAGQVYRLHMELLEPIHESSHLDFEAECVWRRPNVFSPENFDAGFRIARIESKDLPVIETIIRMYALRN